MILVKNSTSGEWEQVAGNFIGNANAPIGAIFPFGGSSAPSGYLMCDGSAVSRTDYSALFAVIGTSFGAGDGSTTFNIPDLRGEFLRGAGTNSHTGQGNGGSVGEHQDATENPNVLAHLNNNWVGGYVTGGSMTSNPVKKPDKNIKSGNAYTVYANSSSFSSPEAIEYYTSRPTNTSVNFIIKAKDVNLSVGGQALADRVETLETTTSGSISGATTNSGTLKSAHYVRSGNVIQLRLTLTDASLTMHGNTTLTVTMPSTVPVPVMTVDGVANIWNGSVDEVGHVRMSSESRDIVIYSSNDSGIDADITDAEVWATVTYITAD